MLTIRLALPILAVGVLVGPLPAPATNPTDTAFAYPHPLKQTDTRENVKAAVPIVDSAGPAHGMAAAPTVFADDFDDGETDGWTVTVVGTALFDVDHVTYVSPPCSVHMQSIADGRATGESPSYDLELSRKYKVSFSFLVPHADNHWFEVFNNHQIYVVIDGDTDLKGYQPSSRTVYPIASLAEDVWYLLEIKANPPADTYDVYLDGEYKTTCSMWVHGGGEADFRIGDRADGSTDKGEAYWDDFVITQGPLGDLDYDGDVDLYDYAIFAEALSGPNQPIDPSADPSADLDEDDDVDLNDFAAFQKAFTGEGPGGQARIGDSSNSGCLTGPQGDPYPCPDDDEIEFTVEGTTLQVLHSNATYNCCPDDIAVSLSVEGTILRLTEEEILTDPCYCTCCYEVEATVVDLAPGEYTVEFCWYDYETEGERCFMEDIVVP